MDSLDVLELVITKSLKDDHLLMDAIKATAAAHPEFDGVLETLWTELKERKQAQVAAERSQLGQVGHG